MEHLGDCIALKASFAKMKDKIDVDAGIGNILKQQSREIKLLHRGKPFNVKFLSETTLLE